MIYSLVAKHNYSEPMKLVLEHLARKSDFFTMSDDLASLGKTIMDLQSESIDFIFDFVELILEDGILTLEEMNTLTFLKRYLHIKEGDFLKYHKEFKIQEIIYLQMQKIYSDLFVDNKEALTKTDLQKLFDLSYDQFLHFERKAVEEALKKGANIRDLDTFYK